jgi:hypothetical protein
MNLASSPKTPLNARDARSARHKPTAEGFCNRTRRHSGIGYISPIEMELKVA